jgi:predicted acyltransferase
MDQFRGYTVAGMFLVNFLGSYAVVHPVLKHNNNYFSYADSIMPSFMFACGFSYRLSALRRQARDGRAAAWRRFAGRSFGLVLLSLMVFGFGTEFHSWSELTSANLAKFVAKLFKANLWEVLAIIGAAQLLILPVITAGVRTRALVMAGLVLAHLALCDAFSFNFVYGGPNALDRALGIPGSTAWDGGCFGLLAWAAIMLAGSLAYDVVVSDGLRAPSRLVGWGVAAMVAGYALSCLSMLYDGQTPLRRGHVAASPVRPPLERLSERPARTLLAEPPFVQPPGPDRRPINYWMMNKKIVSLPFVLFSTGFALALYGLFVLACDQRGRAIGLFRTFGSNALAAYVLHELVLHQVHNLVPRDAPLWGCLAGLAVFYAITYLFVRYLEVQKIHVKL